MIGKIPKAGRGFKGLISYLLHGPAGKEVRDAKGGERPNAGPTKLRHDSRNRVLWTDTRNLITDDPQKAIRIMRATANRSKRCKAPVYHFVISWKDSERPELPALRDIVDHTCADMGLAEHQRVTIAHDDTGHRHVHVVVNRIHPETGKAWNRRQDWVRLEQTLARQALARGFVYVPGRHNDPKGFTSKNRRPPDREYQRARRLGQTPPLMRWGHNRLLAERPQLSAAFNDAGNWAQLHGTLHGLGYKLERKGGGLVLRDAETELKVSLLGKSIRLPLLETKYRQPFQTAPTLDNPLRRDDGIFLKDDGLDPTRGRKTTHPLNTDHSPSPDPSTEVDSPFPSRQHQADPQPEGDPGEDTPSPRRRKRKGR